jgi:HEAT repeat protein
VAPELVEAVRKGPFRDEAVEALVNIGAGAEVTVPILIDRFKKRGCQHLTGQGTFFYDAFVDKALARVGEPAVPALLKILTGPDGDMRVCAAYALGEIGPAARAAVPSLIRAIEHADPKQEEPEILVLYAIRALGRIGPEARAAVPALNGWLDRWDAFDFDAVIALNRLGAPPVRILLDRFLRDGEFFMPYQLAWLGPKAREAAPALRAALADKRLQVRISAAEALAPIDPAATEAVPVLIEGLNHRDDQDLEAWDIPEALARLGPRAKAALPLLIDLVKKGSDDAGLLKALVQIDPEGKECVPALIAALKHEDSFVVDTAANCLALLGPRAKDAIPALAAAMTRDYGESFHEGWNPQVSAARALGRIGQPARSAVPALIGAVRYRHVVRRQADGLNEPGEERDCEAAAAAAEVLGLFGAEARPAIPALIDSLRTSEDDDPSGRLHQAAALALGRIGREARAAIPVLRDLTGKDVRRSPCQAEAVVALYQLAPDGKELAERWLAKPYIARGDLRNWFGLEGRVMVLGAMGRATFEGDWLIRRYLERLDDRLAHVHPSDGDPLKNGEWLLEPLGRFGVAGRLAIPRLKELCGYPDPFVRMWAAEALERIMPPSK